MNQSRRCGFRFFIPLIVLAAVAVGSLIVFGLWNAILPGVLGVKAITYWQAAGILVLSKILFGGFPGRRGGHFGPPWRRRWAMERWEALSPEQREQLRERMRQRFGDWPRPPWCGEGEPKAGDTAN